MKQQTKLSSEQQQVSEHKNEAHAREFASTEELLREDAAHIQVPSAIEQRLAKSVAGIPQPTRSWWKRFLG